jgi:hypothetical protein
MKFLFNMNELSSMVRTFVEEQYGHRTGAVTFVNNAMKSSTDDEAVTVTVEDMGPMPDEADEPAGEEEKL